MPLQGPGGLSHDDAVTQQVLHRLSANYGHIAAWLPTLESFARVCQSLSPEEQAVVQRHLLPATAAQLQQMEQRRHDPQAMAHVLTYGEGGDPRAEADASGPHARQAKHTPHAPHATHTPHAKHITHAPHAKQGAQVGPGGAAARGPSSSGPGHPSGHQGRAGHPGHPGAVPGAVPGAGPLMAGQAPSAPPWSRPGSPLLGPQTSIQTVTTTPGGATIQTGWSSLPPSPLNMQGPVVAQWSSAAPVVGAPVVAAPGWSPPVVVAPQTVIAPTPFMPSPPIVWDACGGMVPYPPYPMWNPMAAPGWPAVGFGMTSPLAPCWADGALSGLGMGLGAGIGAGIGAGMGAGLGHMLGSFAFGHPFC
ncbi:hypothetical protein [Roseateles depolymerans]|nr:hypothetical protein [Roseateles depolymerans]